MISLGGGLVGRPFVIADIPWVWEIGNDPDVRKWTRVPVPFTEGAAVELVRDALDQRALPVLRLAAVDANSDEAFGWVIARVEDGWAEIGYSVMASARGRHVATAMVRGMVGAIVNDVDGVMAQVMVGNDASVAVLLRCGFVEVGSGTCEQRGTEVATRRFRLASGQRVDH